MLLLRCLRHITKLLNNSERSSVIYTPGVWQSLLQSVSRMKDVEAEDMWSLGHMHARAVHAATVIFKRY